MKKLIKSKEIIRNPGFGETGRRWLAILFLFLPKFALSHAPDTLWTNFYHHNDEVRSSSCDRIIHTRDGGIVLGGLIRRNRGYDFSIIKASENGDREWSRIYDLGNIHDVFEGVSMNQTGDLYIAGKVILEEDGEHYSVILKVSPDSDTLWSKRYGRGIFYNVIALPDSSLVAVGQTNEFGANGYLVKIDYDGNIIWRRSYGGEAVDLLKHVIVTRDEGFLMVGWVWPTAASIVKTNSDGEQVWLREFDLQNVPDGFESVVECPDGGYLAGGGSGDYSLLVKYNSEGDTLWSKRPFGGSIKEIVLSSGGGFTVVAGAYAIRFDDLGEPLWTFDGTFDGAFGRFEELNDILAEDDGSYVFGGIRDMGRDPDAAGLIRTEPDPVVLPFELEALEERHDFGDVAVDSVVTWELPLHNFGRRYVFIDSVAFEGDTLAFALDIDGFGNPSYRVDPTDTAFVPVSFHPTADTTYEATLTFFFGDTQSVEVMLSGRGLPLSVPPPLSLIPYPFSLSSFPNPFNSSTAISYSLPTPGSVSLALYDHSGRMVRELGRGYGQAGSHRLILDAKDLTSGLYFVRRNAGGRTLAERVEVMR